MQKANILVVWLLALLLLATNAHKSKKQKEQEDKENFGQRNKDIFNAINKARTNPKYFSQKIQDELDKKFVCDESGSPTKIQWMDETFEAGSASMCQMQVETVEGPPCWSEAKQDIEANAKKLKKLKWHEGLAQACYDLVKDSGPLGRDTHTAYDGSEPIDRINRYGTWKSSGESLSFGEWQDAETIVTRMLIDDGVTDRGNRGNILDPSFTHAGVSCGCHIYYGEMCCIAYGEKMVGNDKKHTCPAAPRVDQCYPYDEGYALGLQNAQSYFYDNFQSSPLINTQEMASMTQVSFGQNMQEQSESMSPQQMTYSSQPDSSGSNYNGAQAQAQAQSSNNYNNGAQAQAESNHNGQNQAQAQSESSRDSFGDSQAQAQAQALSNKGSSSEGAPEDPDCDEDSPTSGSQFPSPMPLNGPLMGPLDPNGPSLTLNSQIGSNKGGWSSTSEASTNGDSSHNYNTFNIDPSKLPDMHLPLPPPLTQPLMGPLNPSGPPYTVKLSNAEPQQDSDDDDDLDDDDWDDDWDDNSSDDDTTPNASTSASAAASNGASSASSSASANGQTENDDSIPWRLPSPVNMQKWNSFTPNGFTQTQSLGSSY